MTFLYPNDRIFVRELGHQLGKAQRDLSGLKEAGLLSSPVDALAKAGYQYQFSAGSDESLLTLATPPIAAALKRCSTPSAFVFHHSYAESASVPWEKTDPDLMSRARYFPAAVLKQFNLDHIPYFGSFASGCTGFLSLLLAAGGILKGSDERAVACVTADIKPDGVGYDGQREKILTSDCSSAFIAGREPGGYQLLGINYYSTTRTLMPLVEIVKRTVQMVRDLGQKLGLEIAPGDFAIHYPNIFPEAWDMVTHYLKVPRERHILEGMAERAHCLSSDSVITLAKWHDGSEGRLHIVVNFGSGLHLGVGIFKETRNHVASI